MKKLCLEKGGFLNSLFGGRVDTSSGGTGEVVYTNYDDTEVRELITDSEGDISDLDDTKADKVKNATANNFAALDSTGNLKDSGKKASDFVDVAAVNKRIYETSVIGLQRNYIADVESYSFLYSMPSTVTAFLTRFGGTTADASSPAPCKTSLYLTYVDNNGYISYFKALGFVNWSYNSTNHYYSLFLITDIFSAELRGTVGNGNALTWSVQSPIYNIDFVPTQSSSKFITSGAVYTAVIKDTIPTENSTKLVTSGGVYNALLSRLGLPLTSIAFDIDDGAIVLQADTTQYVGCFYDGGAIFRMAYVSFVNEDDDVYKFLGIVYSDSDDSSYARVFIGERVIALKKSGSTITLDSTESYTLDDVLLENTSSSSSSNSTPTPDDSTPSPSMSPSYS